MKTEGGLKLLKGVLMGGERLRVDLRLTEDRDQLGPDADGFATLPVFDVPCGCNYEYLSGATQLKTYQYRGRVWFEFLDRTRCEYSWALSRESTLFASPLVTFDADVCPKDPINTKKDLWDDMNSWSEEEKRTLAIGNTIEYVVKPIAKKLAKGVLIDFQSASAFHTIAWESTIKGTVKLGPLAGNHPVKGVKIAWELGQGNVTKGEVISLGDGSFEIDLKVQDKSLDWTTPVPVLLEFSKTTGTAQHTFRCNSGAFSCTNATVYAKHLTFDQEIEIQDDSALPIYGQISIANVRASGVCPLEHAKVCAEVKTRTGDFVPEMCVHTDNKGNFVLLGTLGTVVRVVPSYSNHTFVPINAASAETFTIVTGQEFKGYNFEDVSTTKTSVQIAGGKCNRYLGVARLQPYVNGCPYDYRRIDQTEKEQTHELPAHAIEFEVSSIIDRLKADRKDIVEAFRALNRLQVNLTSAVEGEDGAKGMAEVEPKPIDEPLWIPEDGELLLAGTGFIDRQDEPQLREKTNLKQPSVAFTDNLMNLFAFDEHGMLKMENNDATLMTRFELPKWTSVSAYCVRMHDDVVYYLERSKTALVLWGFEIEAPGSAEVKADLSALLQASGYNPETEVISFDISERVDGLVYFALGQDVFEFKLGAAPVDWAPRVQVGKGVIGAKLNKIQWIKCDGGVLYLSDVGHLVTYRLETSAITTLVEKPGIRAFDVVNGEYITAYTSGQPEYKGKDMDAAKMMFQGVNASFSKVSIVGDFVVASSTTHEQLFIARRKQSYKTEELGVPAVRFQFNGTETLRVVAVGDAFPKKCPQPSNANENYMLLPSRTLTRVVIYAKQDFKGGIGECDQFDSDREISLENNIGLHWDPVSKVGSPADKAEYDKLTREGKEEEAEHYIRCYPRCKLPIQHLINKKGENGTAHATVLLKVGYPEFTKPFYRRLGATIQFKSQTATTITSNVYIQGMEETEKAGSLNLPEYKPLTIIRDPPGGMSSAYYENVVTSVRVDEEKVRELMGVHNDLKLYGGVRLKGKVEAGAIFLFGLVSSGIQFMDIGSLSGASSETDADWLSRYEDETKQSRFTTTWSFRTNNEMYLAGKMSDVFVTPSLTVFLTKNKEVNYDVEACEAKSDSIWAYNLGQEDNKPSLNFVTYLQLTTVELPRLRNVLAQAIKENKPENETQTFRDAIDSWEATLAQYENTNTEMERGHLPAPNKWFSITHKMNAEYRTMGGYSNDSQVRAQHYTSIFPNFDGDMAKNIKQEWEGTNSFTFSGGGAVLDFSVKEEHVDNVVTIIGGDADNLQQSSNAGVFFDTKVATVAAVEAGGSLKYTRDFTSSHTKTIEDGMSTKVGFSLGDPDHRAGITL
uniref:Uncharacterized protein n=1 Tax=Mucochytrium quahogii TaxID=96639 RepID=A0A7S2SCV2_9STRA|mmetsp:Transcript_36367/g.58302  ORF Transcript_36367/g.58302 Transcript_36367/m.58302 type:complete len:1359 (+) Transcript_36367:1-4077(+)